MKNWNEIKTAFHVARLGTVSAAADALGVHRATVIRHIDALEKIFGQKIFLRHARGYTPTEVGLDLMRVAENAEEQFNQLVSRTSLSSENLSGNLIVTSMEVLAPELAPAINIFHERHPRIKVQFMASEKIFALEHGEAHVAARLGAKPTEPDNVVQLLYKHKVGLYASSAYVARHGIPQTKEDFINHFFVERDSNDTKSSFEIWIHENVGRSNFVFQSRSLAVLRSAILSGIGIGFFPEYEATHNSDLISMFPRRRNWEVPVWLVTHVDQHRTGKVQAFLRVLKDNIVQPSLANRKTQTAMQDDQMALVD